MDDVIYFYFRKMFAGGNVENSFEDNLVRSRKTGWMAIVLMWDVMKC